MERDIEFEIGRLADQLDAGGGSLEAIGASNSALAAETSCPSAEKKSMLIDVFELAEVKLTLLEQLHDLLDSTERYWLDQAGLSHRRGSLLREAEALVWQQFLPGVRPDPRQQKRDMTNTERME